MKDNKYIRYCIVEPKCRVRLIVLAVMIMVIIWQLWYRQAQAQKVNALLERSQTIAGIKGMERELKTRAQLEAFRDNDSDKPGQVTFTKISGIAMQGGRPSVLIDETVYGEGDTYGEYVIEKITPEVITLINKKTNARKNLYVFE